MNKVWIVIQREYLNIVKKNTFLISTFLVPLGFALIFGIQIISIRFVEKEDYKVWIQANTEVPLASQLSNTENVIFEEIDLPLDSLRARVMGSKNQAVLVLPQKLAIEKSNADLGISLYSSSTVSEPLIKEITGLVNQAIKKYKTDRAGLTQKQLAQLDFNLDAQFIQWTEEGEKSTNREFASAVGFAVCFLMYMLMGIYGSVLMQGVIEEKSNRIVEVIISSLKPFQLLLGKVLAIASVGITQFILWGILSGVVLFGLSFVAAGAIDPEQLAQASPDAQQTEMMASKTLAVINNFDWSVVWFFPIYFLGGFFLYGSLLAAAGAAVDNIQDAQQFTFPVTIPMLLPILFVYNIIQNPNGVFAVFASLFPFFSPMSMLVRLSLTDVPWYELVLSLVILIASFLGCVWIASKIYHTGILMYGKKPSFKEIWRWVRHN